MTAFNEHDVTLHTPTPAGFAFIPREGKHLFRIADDVNLSDLHSHLSCMLRGMQEIAEDGVADGISSDVAWLMSGLLEQARAIAEELEVPLRRATP
ncbi:hypothetical protein [Dyella telluris]|uniref:DUF3077 domain-containing protein n=1 Tax=Dyella telluris TaxID=2763498 RepID=A0A7G8Q1R6_9GAMM|nr:hypothetical protein [Dyella telluris]QNK00724.1 hypothetical protein H8F01_16775 [Dyella telluris]